MTQTTVLVIDDHPVYLDGFSLMLNDLFANVDLCLASNAKEAIEIASNRIDIDFIYMDYNLPDMDGITLLQALNDLFITAPIIMISGDNSINLIDQAITLGASGFVHKGCAKSVFQECLSTIEKGNVFLTPELNASLSNHRKTIVNDKNIILEKLSDRRMQVLLLISEGYANAEIAESLGISPSTVKTHVAALMEAFDADNRSHCVAEAKKYNIIN